MSQAGGVRGGSNPPASNEFVTDVNSPAIPAGGILDIIGGQTSLSTAAGIQTSGSSGGNTVTIQLTNRVVGSVTTTTAAVTPIAIVSLAGVPAVYNYIINLVAFDVTDGAGAGWNVVATIRSDGTNTFIVGVNDSQNNVDAALMGVVFNAVPGGLGVNTAIFQVTGLAGKTIDWNMVGYYVAVS